MPIATWLSPTVCRQTQPRRHELDDLARLTDHVVRADAGELVQLAVRHVRLERVPDRLPGRRDRDVLDDHARLQLGARVAVVALGVRAHLPLARRGHVDVVVLDRRHRRRGEEGGEEDQRTTMVCDIVTGCSEQKIRYSPGVVSFVR